MQFLSLGLIFDVRAHAWSHIRMPVTFIFFLMFAAFVSSRLKYFDSFLMRSCYLGRLLMFGSWDNSLQSLTRDSETDRCSHLREIWHSRESRRLFSRQWNVGVLVRHHAHEHGTVYLPKKNGAAHALIPFLYRTVGKILYLNACGPRIYRPVSASQSEIQCRKRSMVSPLTSHHLHHVYQASQKP